MPRQSTGWQVPGGAAGDAETKWVFPDKFFDQLPDILADAPPLPSEDEEEPELPDYPKDPAYRAKFGPRGVLKCKATDHDDPTVDPRFGKSANRLSKTPARSPRSAWKQSTTKPRRRRSTT